jgi:filamentous hemagglutinin family protein
MTRVVRAAVLYAVSQWSGIALAGTQLPIPCAPGACSTTSSFVTTGAATAIQSGNSLAVHQTSNSATLNWSSFNIGANGKVVFQQPTSNAVALNRIFDSNPSSIFGALTANGQIYLINANGFLFGKTATVNVAGLLASSLNLTDSTFANGIIAPLQNSAPALEEFTGNSQNFSSDTTGPKITNTGSITVQNGAQLTAADEGRLLLAAPSVVNAGALSAPDGQIVLAAGQNIYLQASADTSLRGLIVQVDGGTAAANQLMGVVNQSSGLLSAPRGNITLTGLMVNQDGRISATTSVSANGSVTLEAAGNPVFNTQPLLASVGGQVTIGSDSSIEILPEYADAKTAVDAQVQLPSTITITGEKVLMQGGSIKAPSGVLTVTAEADPAHGLKSGDNPNARIHVDAGTTIDLAGSDATLPMAANLVTVQLRSNEFADDPAQRNGALRGQTVTVDVRADGGAGTPIANVASAIAAVGRGIAQRTETGGTATFLSEGDIVFSPGASINVSGGATTYLGGNVQTTQLVGANGRIYDIGSANPLLTYTGLINPTLTQTYDKWGVQEVVATPGLSHYEATYVQGAAAGSVQFAAPALALDGSLQANASYGPLQRGPFTSGATLGGTLIIGRPGTTANGNINALTGQTDYFAPPIEITTSPVPIVVGDTISLPPQTLELPVAYLTADGFTNTQLYSNTSFTLPARLPLQLPSGSALLVQASRIDIDSSITDLGGSLSFQSELTAADQNPVGIPTLGPGNPRTGIGVGGGVTFDVSGLWTNDSVLASGLGVGPTLQNAGQINLQLTVPGSELVLGNDVALKANGGAWEQGNGNLSYGKGGSITLDASPSQGALQFGASTTIEAFGAYTASGGSFALLAPRIDISQGTGTGWSEAQRVDDLNAQGQVLQLYAPLFADYGFSNVALTATGAVESTTTNDVLTVQGSSGGKPGATLVAETRSLQLDPGYQTRLSGGEIAGFSQLVTLPLYLRPATNVSLAALREADDVLLGRTGYGTLDVQAGASILADPGASISIEGEGNVSIAGTLRAPGGSVSVELASPGSLNANSVLVDPGYVAGLGITLTPTAVIDVSGGSAVLTPNDQGLLLGTLRAGGSVDIDAQRGSLVVDAGSRMNISGSSATLDVANAQTGGYIAEVVATPAGSLTLGSVESIALSGTIEGKAGVGASGAAAGGSLEIDLTRSEVIQGLPDPTAPLQIELTSGTAGAAMPPALDVATVGLAQITGTGIDALTLNAGGPAPGVISIQTSEPLALNRSLVLESQSLSVADGIVAHISAPYVEIGNPLTLIQTGVTQPAPTAGTGTLMASADQLALVGTLTLQGIGNATFASRGDVQLQGTLDTQGGGVQKGSLLSAGNITIQAARVYPDTFTSFSIEAQEASGAASGASTHVNIDQVVVDGRRVPSPGAPLSGGGSLSIVADNIEVGGTLIAPFGQIALEANDSLTLSNGGLVSVSGRGLEVPYGQTLEDGAQWEYAAGGATAVQVAGTPQKQVSLTAPNLTVQPKATVDLRGGGDLYAYEWVPGTGGSNDSLAGSGAQRVPGLYAILPAQVGQAAPYDPEESVGFNPTQTVYLSGGAGVAAGFYSLLPPRYALAPGALLIQVEPSYTSASAGQIGSLANGTPVLAGYLSSFGTALHTGSTEYQGFAVYPGSYGQQLAAYTISDASSYFSAAAALAGTGPVPVPADAGSLTFSVVAASNALLGNSFNLQGTVQTAAAAGGRGALVNISAPNLVVDPNGETSSANSVAVSGTVLQSWNASALTLGGSTASTGAGSASGGTSVTVAANNVTVDAGVDLTANQIFVVAQQSIDIKGSLSSTSGKAGTTLATLPAQETVTLSDPSAGLVAVSDLGLPVVTRSGSGAGATITLEAGSNLNSGGALALDAPGNVTVQGSAKGAGASWSLASNSIAFVGAGTSTDTLNIDSNLVASLQTAGAVRLSSQGDIDLYAPVSLGASSSTASPSLSALTLLGTEINNTTAADSTFGAAALTLGGVNPPTGGAATLTPAVGAGKLSLVADSLNLAPNAVAVSGFASTLIQVAGSLSSTPVTTSGATASAPGSSATTGPIVSGLNAAGDVTINAVQLTPGAGSQTTISATGALAIGAPTTLAKGTSLSTLVGGALALSANSIADNGVIAAPSGLVSLDASGGDLELGRTGSINVAGTLLQAVNRQAPSPGGVIALNASGNVTLDSGSTINVAGEGVAPAGSLSVAGGAVVTLAGALEGAAGTGGTGGSFTLDAGQLAGGLAPLASTLASGGFSQAVNVRARSGNLYLPQGGAIDANSIVLTADTGEVEIAGVLSAQSGAQRGMIDLSAGTTVSLDATGQLHADGTGTSELGGEIVINSTCATCSITLSPGSVISAAGTKQMGQLILRAPNDTDALGQPDVAINVGSTGIGADVSQAGQVIIEPVMTFATSGATVNTDLPNDLGVVSTYLASASPVISGRLTVPAAVSAPAVQAGLELQDATLGDTLTFEGLTDLSIYSDPAYYSSPSPAQVINLSVRAAGSININGTISDGFINDPNSGETALSSVPSASFSLVAGADTTSANPLSIVKGSAANLTLMSSGTPGDGTTDGVGPSVVRTGTGDINLAASGNVVFDAAAGGMAAAYTGGLAPANVLGPVSYNGGLTANFGSGGGNVRLSAGGDVVGSPVGATYANSDGGNYSVTGWLLHQGGAGVPAQYGVDYGAFDWNVGALGGGDVAVTAGNNVTNLSAAAADSLVSGANTQQGTNPVLYGAGGGLSITAGGDIGTAQIFVADGVGTLIAGGGLTPVGVLTRTGPHGTTISTPVGSSIALDDSQVSVWARNAVQVDAIYNPTYVTQLQQNIDPTLAGGFLTYAPASSVSLSSTTGAVTVELLGGTGTPLQTLVGSKEIAIGSSGFLFAPPNLSVQALQNDILLNGAPTLVPAAEGQLSLFAAVDIAALQGGGNQITVSVSDAVLATLPTAADPSLNGALYVPFQGVIHAGDPDPALITAGRDINAITFSIPKAARIIAGRDMVNLGFEGQNTSVNDTTLISAGRDIVATGLGAGPGIQLNGPGSLEVLTGRNLNLGLGSGIVTLGDLVNPNLPTAAGANVSVMVGYGSQGADLGAFLTGIVEPSKTYQAQLINYVESLNGSTGLSLSQAETEFTSLSTPEQSALIDNVFFNELLLSGRAANSGAGVGFQEGYAAINALFPGSRSKIPNPYDGDLTLISSRIYTDSGGDISILVPGGQVNVGLANPPASIVAKPASSLGIVAEGSGNVSIYTEGDVNVNKSRVFTLGGGNILIWSDEGSIDAGNGSKSSLSVPPPIVTINNQGVVSLNFGASLAAGSGIRTIQTSPSVPPGNVDLDAPVGTVNAGDAGIGASGNINIAAAHVIGVDNINFGGTASGVPSDLSGLAASLSGVSAVAAGTTTSSTSAVTEAAANKETAPIAQTALSWLDVFVTGLGEENCKQDDIECLKRQKSAAP